MAAGMFVKEHQITLKLQNKSTNEIFINSGFAVGLYW